MVTSTLAVHHIAENGRTTAFGEMYRVLRPSGRLLIADFRPSGRRLTLHTGGHGMRHGAVPLDDLAVAAGFQVQAEGDLPLLRYVLAVRPPDASSENPRG